jgi:hypothetical protein
MKFLWIVLLSVRQPENVTLGLNKSGESKPRTEIACSNETKCPTYEKNSPEPISETNRLNDSLEISP